MLNTPLDQLLDRGIDSQASGDLRAAEVAFRAALEIEPDNPDALHLLAIICHQTGRHQQALDLLLQAVTLAPDEPLFQFNLAEVLLANNALPLAVDAYLRALELDPSLSRAYLPLIESLLNLGRTKEAAARLAAAFAAAATSTEFLRLARAAEAAESLDLAVDAATRAAELAPDNPEPLDLLAKLLTRQYRFAVLPDIYQRLIKLDPLERYYIGLASAHAECKDYASAKNVALETLRIFPNANDAHFILGHCADRQADLLAAAKHYSDAVNGNPKHVPSLMNLSVVLRASGCLLEALDSVKRAYELMPDNFGIAYNLAFTYHSLGQLSEAIDTCRITLKLKPDHASTINLLAASLQKSRRSHEASEILEPFILENPLDTSAHTTLASIYMDRGDMEKAIEAFRRSTDPKNPDTATNGNVLLCSTYLDTISPRELFDRHVQWGLLQPKPDAPAPTIASRKHSKIRIGYISPDLKTHSVAFFACPVLMFHDKSAFDIYCYANIHGADNVTKMFQDLGHQWRHITGISEDRVFDMIRRDEIDILIDLAGHTGGTCLPHLAKRPAPIQVSMIGYPCTTGLPTIDYQITDNILHPPGIDEYVATEKLVRLPSIFACYRPPDNAPPVGPLPALAAGHVTFGYFNNLAKLRDSVLHAWSLIIQKLPTAIIVLQTGALDDPSIAEFTKQRCIDAGIPEKNLDIRGLSSLAKFHDDLNTVDIVLDPFPFNGHTTSCQILHMGVPIVTLAGHTRSGRMGASLLYNLGLRKLVAHSVEEYADIAVRLANDLPALTSIRANLREKMELSPIMDAHRYVHDLEDAFRQMVADAGGL